MNNAVLLFTDHDESFNGRCQWVEEDAVVLPVVVALEMVACGGREEHRKLPLWRESTVERERDSCRRGERAVSSSSRACRRGEERELSLWLLWPSSSSPATRELDAALCMQFNPTTRFVQRRGRDEAQTRG